MRLWSLHPQYLDRQGLLALWREALLAKKVLSGKTVGYKNHPQLLRFKHLPQPIAGINLYLDAIFQESQSRGYSFDQSKVDAVDLGLWIKVSSGQLNYEFSHLLKKLKKRDALKFKQLSQEKTVIPHPMFKVYQGRVEDWERRH
jgi:hypothetical protein